MLRKHIYKHVKAYFGFCFCVFVPFQLFERIGDKLFFLFLIRDKCGMRFARTLDIRTDVFKLFSDIRKKRIEAFELFHLSRNGFIRFSNRFKLILGVYLRMSDIVLDYLITVFGFVYFFPQCLDIRIERHLSLLVFL